MTYTFQKTLFAVTLLGLIVLWAGSALAYLSPSNPAVNSETAGQILYMDPTYLGNYTATPDTTFVIGPGDIPDYQSSPNWAYSPPLRKFVDALPPLGCDQPTANDQCIPVAVPDIVTYPGSDYYEIHLVEFREQMHSDLPATPMTRDYGYDNVTKTYKYPSVTTYGTLHRGYMQINSGTDTSGGCVDPSVAVEGTDIACTADENIVEAQSRPHHLGPIIVAQKDRPVRVKFVNELPTGAGGDLFLPVDTSIMGAGPYDIDYDPLDNATLPGANNTGNFTQNRGLLHLHGGRSPWISDGTPHQWITPDGEDTTYPTGVSTTNVPDMPDPGPGANTYYWTNQQSSRMMFYHDHAWGITRLNVYVGEAAGYLIREESEQQLIDNNIIPGTKSAAAGGGTSYGGEIPLVLEGKTFVDARGDKTTNPNHVWNTDPTWKWGNTDPSSSPTVVNGRYSYKEPVTGDFWWPHVYMPAQNNSDPSGIAPMGRWAYGPWFWPATNNEFQPIANPYYAAECGTVGANPDYCGCNPLLESTPGSYGGFCQPPQIPSSPNPSWGAEAFMDTPTVNGTAYPVMNVEPKPYRLRILNADHDRFYNLHMYIADNDPTNPATQLDPGNIPSVVPNCADFGPGGVVGAGSCATGTEVRMVGAATAATSNAPPGGSVISKPPAWPEDGRPGGVPDWSWRGPDWIMIGSEGGFLPRPVVIPPQPLIWNVDVTTFNAGNVKGGSLILGPAERADVIVDFSAYAGKTLIVYNDAPAPWPALDPHYDYYTRAPDNRAMGGADSTAIGFGPNIRTVMQIKIGTGGGQSFDLSALQHEFGFGTNSDGSPDGTTVTPAVLTQPAFLASQDDLIVGQGNVNPTKDSALYEAFPFDGPFDGVSGYDYSLDYGVINALYGKTFATLPPNWGMAQINDTVINIVDPVTDAVSTIDMQPKAIHDEQGATFDEFGRMRAGLGLTTDPAIQQVNFVVQTYSDPATEILAENEVQVWKITHNGVDSHPIHFHLYDVQVLNRVGWDGFNRYPDPTEMGWKDTVRISPLEDTVVAIRPVTPRVPFGVPESVRPLNPATPIDSGVHLSLVDPTTGQAWATPNLNKIVNFDWEYVWHCHILSHEENDMMRPQSFLFAELLPDAPSGVAAAATVNGQIALSWTDATPANAPATFGDHKNEIGFTIYRSENGAPFAKLADTLANATGYVDATVTQGTPYYYQLESWNAKGVSTQSNIAALTTPKVALTAPAADATFVAPFDLTLTAAISADIQSVTFYDGATNIGTVSSPVGGPFELVSTIAATGIHTLSAVAFDGTNTYTSASVPITVLGVTAAPTTLNVPTTSAGTNTISWSAVSPVMAGAITYTLQQSYNSGAFTTVYSGPANSVDLTLFNSGNYTYQVAATEAGLSISPWTAGSGTWTIAIATAPASALTVPASSATGNYTVSWTASPTVGATYTLQESTDSFASNSAEWTGLTTTTQSVTGRSNGTYAYRVIATAAGNTPTMAASAPTATSSITVAYPTAVPPSITVPVRSTSGSYTVSWTASPTAGATYTLQESTTANFSAGTFTTVQAGITGLSKVITPAKTDGIYYYRVNATAPTYAASPWRVGTNGTAILRTTLTSPASGTAVTLGNAVDLTATATTPVGYTIDTIEFYDNGTLVDIAAAGSPYTVSYTPAATGGHNVMALTYYLNGASSPSPTVAFNVTGAVTPPVFTSPTVTTVDLGTSITLSADVASISGAAINLVGYFDNSTTPATTIGFAVAPPYTAVWTPTTGGTKNLTAVAYYSNTDIATSAVLPVTVNDTVAAPASITVPASSTTGNYTVSWTLAATPTIGATYTLQESTDPLFASISSEWSGLSTTFVDVTGSTTGTYYYRVKGVKAPMTDSGWVSGTMTVKINAALQSSGGVATASSTGGGWSLPAVNNGDRNATGGTAGAWIDATKNVYPDTVTITFNGQKTIDEIDVFTFKDNFTNLSAISPSETFTQYGITAFDVQYWNGVSWVTVPGGSVTGNNLVWKQITFPAVSTDKIRVVVNGSVDGFSRIVEIEAITTSATVAPTPTVSMTAPADGTVYPTAPATFDLTADVSTVTGWTTTKVEFYNGSTLVGTANSAPYTFSLVNAPAGSYSLTARAYESLGATVDSAPISVTVGAAVNVAQQSNGGVATASSTGAGWSLTAVNNSDRNATGGVSGAWIDATKNVYPDTVTITFNGQKSIDEIDVFTFKDNFTNLSAISPSVTFTQYGITAFDVQYWNGVSWVTVPGGNVTGNNLVWKQITFPAVSTDKIRVVVNGSVDGFSRIVEIEAYTP